MKNKSWILVLVISFLVIAVIVLAGTFSNFRTQKFKNEFMRSSSSSLVLEVTSNQSKIQVAACKQIVKANLDKYERFLGSLKKVVIHNDSNLRRGLANANVVYVKCLPDLEEFVNVFVHELGHVIDLGYLVGEKGNKTTFDDFGVPVMSEDPSYLFYSISWDSTTVKNKRSNDLNFVSGYAQSDPFEDFAEAFMMYERYNEVFVAYANSNPVMQKKYNFIRDKVYNADYSVTLASLNLVDLQLDQIRFYDATRFHQYRAFAL